MWNMVYASVFIKDGPLTLVYIDYYDSSKALVLPPHYMEVVN